MVRRGRAVGGRGACGVVEWVVTYGSEVQPFQISSGCVARGLHPGHESLKKVSEVEGEGGDEMEGGGEDKDWSGGGGGGQDESGGESKGALAPPLPLLTLLLYTPGPTVSVDQYEGLVIGIVLKQAFVKAHRSVAVIEEGAARLVQAKVVLALVVG